MNSDIAPVQERNYLFDNIKALMLFLVPLGHTLDVYISDGNIELYIMKYIYLFHMPIFAFVTGYFTKNLERARENAVKKCLIPYLLFQGIYIVVALIMVKLNLVHFNASIFNSSILLPSSAFYYLLAVFFWKLLGKDIFSFRYPLLLSIILGLVISCTSYQDFHQGLGASFSLLPFFVLGVMCTESTVQKIRRIPKYISLLILFLGILPAIYLPYAIHSVRMTYASVGFSNIIGILYRLLFYIIATLFGIAFINLMPQKKLCISRIGKSSILVYAGSTFLAPHAYILIAQICNLSAHRWINLISMFAFCLILVTLFSIPLFLKWYQAIINLINKILFKKKSE